MIPLVSIGPAVFAYAGFVLWGSIVVDALRACETLFLPRDRT